MPEAKSKDTGVKITDAGSHVVDDKDVAEVAAMPKGFKFIEQGVITVAAPKEELDKARAEGTVTDKALRNDPFPAEKTEKPRRKRSVDMFKPEPKAEAEVEEIVEAKPEKVSEAEGELVELDEVEFLKASGVFSEYVKSMDDVDKNIEILQGRIIALDGFEGNETLFMPDATADPESKIKTLRRLRSVFNQVTRDRKAQQQVEKEPEKPKRAIDMLSEEEKIQLANGENMAEILDKLMELKVNEKMQPLNRKIQLSELETKLAPLGLTKAEFDVEVNTILQEKPYLKKVLSIDLTIDDKIDLLQKYRGNKYNGEEIEAARAAGRDEARALELKRKANFTLKPTIATRTVQTVTNSEQRKLENQLAEARQARKEGKRVHVSNIVADLARTRRTDRG